LPEILADSRLLQNSSLVPMGAYVMDWPADYYEFRRLFVSVGNAYARMMTGQGPFLLDFEYKKTQPASLQVKQVRELPHVVPTNTTSPLYLLSDPVVLIPRQGVDADLFATHRLKSRWTLRTRNIRLDATNLTSTFLTSVTIEHLNSNRIETISMQVTNLKDFSYSAVPIQGGWRTTHAWQMPTLAGPARVQIFNSFSDALSSAPLDLPLVTVRDFLLDATYSEPVPSNRYFQWSSVTNESIYLRPEIDVRSVPNARRIEHTQTFYLDDNPFTISTAADHGIEGGDNPWLTGPLQTRIEGLTTEPILLTNFFSQTTANFHLSAVHAYIFEPRLEPGISQTILDELEALNIQILFFLSPSGPGGNVLKTMSRDGTFRNLPAAGERLR